MDASRKIVFFAFFFWAAVLTAAQERYALLIGIGQYPETSGWESIHGDNDVSIIRPLLLEQGFKEENITVLINESATKQAIMNALDGLRENAHKGDIFYIHFSGHGQQVSDLDGDEEDHFDESWVPYDAQKRYIAGIYEGENHILDDELNHYLNGLRSVVGSIGKIILISDACHSGSGSRGFRDASETFARGTSEKFIIPIISPNIIRKSAPVSWLFVGACKPYQINYEYKADDGLFYGSLSYVIANDPSSWVTSDYRDIINQWRIRLTEITRFPQDMEDEGRPSRKNNLML